MPLLSFLYLLISILPPPPTSSVPLATSIYCSIELLMFLILDEKRSRAAAPLICAFELWVTLLPPHWMLQSQVITSWLITHRDTCPRTHAHTHRWLLLLHVASFAVRAHCKLKVIWSLCLKPAYFPRPCRVRQRTKHLNVILPWSLS